MLRWVEQCARWCCGGWRDGEPKFSELTNEGARIFAEALYSDDKKLDFQRRLVDFLWSRKDSSLPLHTWLLEFRCAQLEPLFGACATLADESVYLDALIANTAAGTPAEDLTLGVFCGKGEAFDRLNLSTLHSAKGREFRVVILFAIDKNRLPRKGAQGHELLEGRRLFYVGFTRAKEEIHIVSTSGSTSPFATELKQRLQAEDTD